MRVVKRVLARPQKSWMPCTPLHVLEMENQSAIVP